MVTNKSSPLWQEFRACSPIVNAFSRFRVNNGEKVIFWESRWVDNIALKYALPELYQISANKEYTVARILSKFRTSHIGLFSIQSITSFVANLISLQLHKFINIMESLDLNSEDNDILWSSSADNIFSVKTCYNQLNDGGLRFQFRLNIWKSCVPLKINFFAWLVTYDKILSRENLTKKGWIGSINYVFCGYVLESTDHIFLHCPVVLTVWNFFLHNYNCINNIHICEIFSLFTCVKFNLSLHCWNMLVLAITWCMWLNRNSMIFRNQCRNLSSLLFQIITLMTSWVDNLLLDHEIFSQVI